MKLKKTPSIWYREVNVRKMRCVLCGELIEPLSKILTSHFRGTIVLCNKCEQTIPHDRLEINENSIIGYHGCAFKH